MSKEFIGGFEIAENENIHNGANSMIDSVILSKGDHSLNLLRKTVRGYPADFMQGPKLHSFLKEKGYPVLPTFRYDSKNQVEYLTDLRRGGTHRVIDFCGGQGNYEKIYVSNMAELEIEMNKLLEKSADDGLIINEPNIFFDVEISSGIAKIVLGDIREIGYEAGYDGPVATREQVHEHNQEILKGHMDRLKSIMAEKPL